MRILYAIQATGNGHISRAMELLPFLREYGSVDIFLSGNNSNLALDAPIQYRSKGLSLYYNCSGGLDYWEMMKKFHPLRLRQEIRDLPVEKYDLVLNDFEYITAAACAKKRIPSINFGHQASFQSPHTPRPTKQSNAGEWILKNYARATKYTGLHFQPYDDFIFTPIIKQDILLAEPQDDQYITVYLPSYCEQQLIDIFKPLDARFEIFCGQVNTEKRLGHLSLLPVNKDRFNKSLINCTGIITGGGFETPAEALHLEKKIISIPIHGQYEQQCNAAALSEMGIMTLKKIDAEFANQFDNWMNDVRRIEVDYRDSISQALEHVFEKELILAD